jgi:integrase
MKILQALKKHKAPEKREYLMTPDEFERFKSACNPGNRVYLLPGTKPLSAEERAAVFWNGLSEKYRFDATTVEPALDKEHAGWFRAVPLPEENEHGTTVH